MKSKKELLDDLAQCSEHAYTNYASIKCDDMYPEEANKNLLLEVKLMVGEIKEEWAERELEYARRGLLLAHRLRELSKPVRPLSPLSLRPPRPI